MITCTCMWSARTFLSMRFILSFEQNRVEWNFRVKALNGQPFVPCIEATQSLLCTCITYMYIIYM